MQHPLPVPAEMPRSLGPPNSRGSKPKPSTRPFPSPKSPRRPALSETGSVPDCPGLPDGAPSERQSLRCEILDLVALHAQLGYGGPINAEAVDDGTPTAKRADEVKKRVRKMLELGFHPKTPEAERLQALRNAKRIMHEHNLQDADMSVGSSIVDGGLFAAKLVPIKRTQRMARESWALSLVSATRITFSVSSYAVLRRDALYVVFYGSSAAAEMAIYAFACAANLIDWMSGGRALPKDKKVTFGTKHYGAQFSPVLRKDAGYVQWATRVEHEPGGAGNCLQQFIEYARAQQNPVEWDRAYKEGMASALHRKAKEAQDPQDSNPQCQDLATSNEALSQQVFQYFGIQVTHGSCGVLKSDGLRHARGSGSRDAGAVHLGQHQLRAEKCLALQ